MDTKSIKYMAMSLADTCIVDEKKQTINIQNTIVDDICARIEVLEKEKKLLERIDYESDLQDRFDMEPCEHQKKIDKLLLRVDAQDVLLKAANSDVVLLARVKDDLKMSLDMLKHEYVIQSRAYDKARVQLYAFEQEAVACRAKIAEIATILL